MGLSAKGLGFQDTDLRLKAQGFAGLRGTQKSNVRKAPEKRLCFRR